MAQPIIDTINEIQEQIAACGGDGTAFTEWVEARGLDMNEFMYITSHEAESLEAALATDTVSLSFVGILQAAFRWGYEVAVKREREGFLQ